MAQLPLYHRSPRFGPPTSRRWKENYLLLLILVAFVMLVAGTWWYIPSLESEDDEYEKVYNKFNPTVNLQGRNVAPPLPTLRRHGEGKEEEGEGKREGEGPEKNAHKLDREVGNSEMEVVDGEGRRENSPAGDGGSDNAVAEEERPLNSDIKDEEIKHWATEEGGREGQTTAEEQRTLATEEAKETERLEFDLENEKRRLKIIDVSERKIHCCALFLCSLSCSSKWQITLKNQHWHPWVRGGVHL